MKVTINWSDGTASVYHDVTSYTGIQGGVLKFVQQLPGGGTATYEIPQDRIKSVLIEV